MALDTTPLLAKVAALADELERDYGTDVELADAVIIVELRARDEDGDPISTVEGRILSERNTAGVGMVTRALYSMVAPD